MSERVNQVLASVLGVVVALWPTWAFVGAWMLVGPEGSWQAFALLALGVVTAGSVQMFMLAVLLVWMEAVWEA